MTYQEKMNALTQNLEQLKKVYYTKKAKMEQLTERKNSLEEVLNRSIQNLDLMESVGVLLRKTSEYAREESKKKIEAIVTNCLQFIFDSAIEFQIEMTESRGKPDAAFYVISNTDGMIIKTEPENARGGVIDIISLSLRVAMLQCTGVDVEGPIILDEPAKHVSEEYINHVAEFIKQITEMFGRQVIMVTHNKHLSEIADKWYKIEIHNAISRVIIDY